MERAKVLMLATSSGMYDLTPAQQKLADSEEFWAKLEETPESDLSDEQRDLIAALGVQIPRE